VLDCCERLKALVGRRLRKGTNSGLPLAVGRRTDPRFSFVRGSGTRRLTGMTTVSCLG